LEVVEEARGVGGWRLEGTLLEGSGFVPPAAPKSFNGFIVGAGVVDLEAFGCVEGFTHWARLGTSIAAGGGVVEVHDAGYTAGRGEGEVFAIVAVPCGVVELCSEERLEPQKRICG